MAEIVYSETQSHRQHLDNLTEGRTVADTKLSVFSGDGKVALVASHLLVGVNRHSKNKSKWYHWRTVSSMGFYRNSVGNAHPYYASRSLEATRPGPWRHIPAQKVFDMLDGFELGQEAIRDAFVHEVWNRFNITSMYDVYPMAAKYELPSYSLLPYDLRPAMRTDDWSDFTAASFGKQRATPRLIEAVQNTEPYIVAVAQQFRGLVSNQRLTSFIENNHFDDEMMEGFNAHHPYLRPWLKLLSATSRDRLLSRNLDISDLRHIQGIAYGVRSDVARALRHKGLSTKSLMGSAPTPKNSINLNTWQEFAASRVLAF